MLGGIGCDSGGAMEFFIFHGCANNTRSLRIFFIFGGAVTGRPACHSLAARGVW